MARNGVRFASHEKRSLFSLRSFHRNPYRTTFMILNTGEYIHIIHRQLFQEDVRRHFVGTVEAHEGTIVRVKGYLFAMDAKGNEFVRRPQLRTRIISLSDCVIVNSLPAQVQIDKITYNHLPEGDILVTDGSDWHLDITHL